MCGLGMFLLHIIATARTFANTVGNSEEAYNMHFNGYTRIIALRCLEPEEKRQHNS
jgi:hypothetical protein